VETQQAREFWIYSLTEINSSKKIMGLEESGGLHLPEKSASKFIQL